MARGNEGPVVTKKRSTERIIKFFSDDEYKFTKLQFKLDDEREIFTLQGGPGFKLQVGVLRKFALLD
jgi:hypothetical protein